MPLGEMTGTTAMTHTCSACGKSFSLPPIPGAVDRIFTSTRGHIGFGEYVYAICPACGHKDWAEERRFWGVIGPRGFYAVGLLLACFFVIAVLYLGFVGL